MRARPGSGKRTVGLGNSSNLARFPFPSSFPFRTSGSLRFLELGEEGDETDEGTGGNKTLLDVSYMLLLIEPIGEDGILFDGGNPTDGNGNGILLLLLLTTPLLLLGESSLVGDEGALAEPSRGFLAAGRSTLPLADNVIPFADNVIPAIAEGEGGDRVAMLVMDRTCVVVLMVVTVVVALVAVFVDVVGTEFVAAEIVELADFLFRFLLDSGRFPPGKTKSGSLSSFTH